MHNSQYTNKIYNIDVKVEIKYSWFFSHQPIVLLTDELRLDTSAKYFADRTMRYFTNYI